MNFDISLIAEVGYIATMLVLLLFSIISITVIIERGFFYNFNNRLSIDETNKKMMEVLKNTDIYAGLKYCEHQMRSSAVVFKSGLTYIKEQSIDKVNTEHLQTTMFNTIENEKTKLEKFLGILGSIGTTAPLIGLFGTVLGIIESFQLIEAQHSSEFHVVAGGIKHALYTTALGILVAVPAIMFYNFYVRKSKVTLEQLDNLASKFVLTVEEKQKEDGNIESKSS